MPSLDGHSAVVWRDYAIYFGGKDIDRKDFIDTMWRLDLNRYVQPRMEIVDQAGTVPTPRAYHGACVAAKYMIVHGGVVSGGNAGRDPTEVYFFDCDADEWMMRRTSGEVPCARSHHTISARGDTMFLYGGFPDADVSTSQAGAVDPLAPVQQTMRAIYDVYEMNITQCAWRRIQCTLAPPPMLWGHANVLYNDNLLIFGGVDVVDGTETSAICVWHTERAQWRWVEIPDAPRPRALHTATLYNDTVILFGGMSGVNQAQLGDVWAFSLEAGEWAELQTQGGRPPPRSGHAAVVYQNKLFVLGGVDATDRSNSRLYVLDLLGLHWVHADPVYEAPPRRTASVSAASLPPPQLYGTYQPRLHEVVSRALTMPGDATPSPMRESFVPNLSPHTAMPSSSYMAQERLAVARHVKESVARTQNLQCLTTNTTNALRNQIDEIERKLQNIDARSFVHVAGVGEGVSGGAGASSSSMLRPLSKEDAVYLPKPRGVGASPSSSRSASLFTGPGR